MGCQAQPNHSLLIGVIVYLLDLMSKDAREAERLNCATNANELWKIGAYICTLTCASLRGHKGFYLDLAGVGKGLTKGRVGMIPVGFNRSTVLKEEDCLNLPHVTIIC